MLLCRQMKHASAPVSGWIGINDMCRFYCRLCQYQGILDKVRMKMFNAHNVILIIFGGVGLRHVTDCLSCTA